MSHPAFDASSGQAGSQRRADDVRVLGYDPLIPPELLTSEIQLSDASKATILKGRTDIIDIISQKDDRLLVVCGPCSVHDPDAALEYCDRLAVAADKLKDDLCIIMRTYLEKPRTTVGWKGLVNDPDLDESFKINKGLRISRKLYCDVTERGVPIANEVLDTISPQYFADLISFGAIGARTTESQLHRQLVSGLSFPVGFKNSTDGTVGNAVDAIGASAAKHHFLGVTKQGLAAITKTAGNKDCFLILRGGASGPNFDSNGVAYAKKALQDKGLRPAFVIDCSHGNSQKNHKNQPKCASDIAGQMKSGERAIVGVMLESNLEEGNQKMPKEGPQALKKGVSITDACISWVDTEPVLEELAEAVRVRRKTSETNGANGIVNGVH